MERAAKEVLKMIFNSIYILFVIYGVVGTLREPCENLIETLVCITSRHVILIFCHVDKLSRGVHVT